ncbi:MAG: FecR family protein [Candidatus Neomarinimicrobiota bacterium]
MRLKFRKIILFFFIFSCLSIYSTAAIAKENAFLSKLKGDVDVFKPGKTKGLEGKTGMPLLIRDKVKTTGKDSSADISFPNGDVVRIMPDSSLEIKESDFKKKTSSVLLKLYAGKIFNVIRKFRKGSKYQIETNNAVAGVRGTIWSAETSEKGEDVFMVKEGKVAATNPEVAPEKEIIVSDLKKTVVKADKPPTVPIPLTPEEIAMFDILEDILQDMKEDIKDEIKEGIAEDILEQQFNP